MKQEFLKKSIGEPQYTTGLGMIFYGTDVTYRVQKDAEQNFDTYEDPTWAINYNLKTFLKSSKPFVLFISDMSLTLRALA